MKIKKNLKAAILIAIIVAVVSITPIASASDWQQFQKDEIHTGYTADTAPISDPVMAWNYSTSGGGWSGIDTTPIVADGKVFALNYQGYLYAFNATTGAYIWDVLCNEGEGQFELAVPAYHDGIVYAATSGGAANVGHGRVTAVHADSGLIREMVDLSAGADGFQLNTPVTYADNRIYVGSWKGDTTTTNDSGTYFCLKANDVSDVIWSRTADYNTGYYWAGSAIIGRYLVFGDDRSNVTCLDKETGALIDHINVSETCGLNAKEIRSSIVWNDVNDRIYFTSKGGYAFALGFDQTTGHFIPTDHWNTSIGYSTSTPVVYDGRLYVGQGGFGNNGKVYCMSESDGSAIWSTPNLGGVQASPALSVVNGRKFIYFTINNDNGSAYCLEDLGSTYTTQWIWNPPYPDDQHILQGMVISDGMVYFGTDEGYVYALKSGLEQFDIPIYNGMNLIAVPLILDDTSLGAVFGDNPVNWDKVRRYISGVGYKTAYYYDGVWYGKVAEVEPMEPEVGYECEREGADYTLTVHGTRCTGTISTPIYNGMNLIGYVNFADTDLSTFNSPVNWDKVRRYISGVGYKTAYYYDGVWYGKVAEVEPIEVGVGYEYERDGAQYNWIYEA